MRKSHLQIAAALVAGALIGGVATGVYYHRLLTIVARFSGDSTANLTRESLVFALDLAELSDSGDDEGFAKRIRKAIREYEAILAFGNSCQSADVCAEVQKARQRAAAYAERTGIEMRRK